MECTQRLENTQDIYNSTSERICPEQIGFLGICGVKHPVKRGPNKIGRDPQTCNIVLNLNSISRQHAVINVLNQNEYMLMDLDSANKTKLMTKTLQPYIPYVLSNGDMVQFGDIFGVFRLLEDDTDLPMTQAIDIPETPVSTKHASKLKAPITTIPESPDVSDRDDSFIAPSQPKGNKCFRNSNSHYVKPSSNTISIQPIGTNKIDNVYWTSSKTSLSFNSNLDESNRSLNESEIKQVDPVNKSIHEIETQAFVLGEKSTNVSNTCIHTKEKQDVGELKIPLKDIFDMETQNPFMSNTNNIHDLETQPFISSDNKTKEKTVYEMDTQVPNCANESIDSIYTANTQMIDSSPSIHSLATQIPDIKKEQLPEVCKIDRQHEMHLNLFAVTKKYDDIFEKETQFIDNPSNPRTIPNDDCNESSRKSSVSSCGKRSDEVILFDEIDTQNYENYDSQPLLPNNNIFLQNSPEIDKKDENKKPDIDESKIKNIDVTIHSDSSIDCKDIAILPTQKRFPNDNDDDLTDCEDLFDEIKVKPTLNKPVQDVNFEDMLTQVIDENTQINDADRISDCPTQVITLERNDEHVNNKADLTTETSFEELATQIITEESIDTEIVKIKDQKVPENLFKIPFQSPQIVRRKDIKKEAIEKIESIKTVTKVTEDEDIHYYSSTQDILYDLCSQKITAVESNQVDEEPVPCSVEDYKIGERFPYLENNELPNDNLYSTKEAGDCHEKINRGVSKLTNQQIRDVIGVDQIVDKIRKVPSDSDLELTPKKVQPMKFMEIDLPDSQEIKTNISRYSKIAATETSSESENESEECTPILFRKKNKPKSDPKIDLTKKFNIESLPTRVITRVRKPTTKLQNMDGSSSSKILQPTFIIDQEEDIDNDIINENISRLKSKSDKFKNKNSEPSKKNECLKDEGQNVIIIKNPNERPKHNNYADKIQTDSKHVIREDKKSNSNKRVKRDLKPKCYDDPTTSDKCEQSSKVEVKTKRSYKKNKEKEGKLDNTKRESKRKLNNTSIDNVKTYTNKNTEDSLKHISTEITMTKENEDKNKIENSTKRESKRKTKNTPVDNVKTETSKNKDYSLKNISNDSTRSTRSTRATRKVNALEVGESVEISHNIKKNKDNESNKMSIDLTVEPSEIRRSTRQRSSKKKIEDKSLEKIESNKKTTKNIGAPVKQEQSMVFSVSSESGNDSPNNKKRLATNDLDPPSSKRTRYNRKLENSSDSFQRSTPVRMNKTQYVLFTAFPSEEVKAKLEKLGAVIVTDVISCTMVLTLQIKRTFKLLCAVGLGRPIVGADWVQACADSKMIVDPWLHILKDEAAEKRFRFNLERVLLSKRGFLNGYNVSTTPKVMPTAPEMKLIVECSGGTWKAGSSPTAQWVCVSCHGDSGLWPQLRKAGAVVVSTEFILGGVLRQKVDMSSCRL